jgi:hypothetical protein
MNSSPSLNSHFEKLQLRVANAANEEELRLAWVSALENALGVEFHAERARRDLSYNNVAIEFKGPGKFKGKKSSSAFKEATEQRLLPYILQVSKDERIDPSDYIGIAIDGKHLAFSQVVGTQINTEHLLLITPLTFAMVVEACRKSFRRPVTASNLIEDFGHASRRGIALMRALVDALADALGKNGNKKIQMLFEEWRTLYGQVAALSKEQLKDINGALRFSFSGHARDDIPARLFVIHTFHSLLIKLLAAEIVSAHHLASGTAFAQELATSATDADLLFRLQRDIEHGQYFDAVGVHGFVEEAIFSWYLDSAASAPHNTTIIQAIREILAELSLYRTDKLDRSRDIIRDFYQDLVPDTLRKSLGEFYTPQWLVEATVEGSGVKDWIGTRVLDPTCGSGSFLIEVIKRKRDAAKGAGMSAAETVAMLADTVWGFDLNPLAVQASRTNFLIAIADLLRVTPGQQIEIPVLLADAVYSPAPPPGSGSNIVEYRIGSQVADLKVLLPQALAFDRARLDRVFEIMRECVGGDLDFAACGKRLLASAGVTKAELKEWTPPLQSTYEQVLALHKSSWNGIWFRIVRNFFGRPLRVSLTWSWATRHGSVGPSFPRSIASARSRHASSTTFSPILRITVGTNSIYPG